MDVTALEIGDVALSFDPCSKQVKEIKLLSHQKVVNEVMTYNLSKINNNHNFFANGILVHNKSND